MIKLPDEYVATRYPGYFFNTQDQKLYSLKVDGVLKTLRFHRPNHFNHMAGMMVRLKSGDRVRCTGGYYISVRGRRRLLPLEVLLDIEPHDHTIPVRSKHD